ncbi:MAG: transporter ATP-binding protein, partial [Phenylobacterium sp.]|nr:transporter ATP-binding protein [Phenylobacterium sp.]
AGFEQPTEGEISIAGAPVVGVPPHKRAVNTVFQQYALFPHMSVLDNVAYGLKQRGVSRRERREEARRLLALVHLEGREQARPAQLSGGMAMRVSLARALVTEPRLLLLDEPFAALDEITRRALADDVLNLWQALRPAIVFVTHNVEEAVYMASRVVVMSRGPGRLAGEIAVEGPLPRPAGFRTSAGFRKAVETVSAALAEGMAA